MPAFASSAKVDIMELLVSGPEEDLVADSVPNLVVTEVNHPARNDSHRRHGHRHHQEVYLQRKACQCPDVRSSRQNVHKWACLHHPEEDYKSKENTIL